MVLFLFLRVSIMMWSLQSHFSLIVRQPEACMVGSVPKAVNQNFVNAIRCLQCAAVTCLFMSDTSWY